MGNAVAYWGFPLDAALVDLAKTTADRVRASADAQAEGLNTAAADVVRGLTDAGLYHLYQRPASMVPMHPLAKKTADSGIKVVMGAVNLAISQFFKKRSHQELLDLSEYLSKMLWEHPERQQPHLVFEIDAGLHQRAVGLLAKVREDSNTHLYMDGVIDALGDLVEHSILHYYQTPSDLVGLRGTSRKTIDLGIRTAEKAVRKLIDKLVRDLSHAHLVELSFHVESMIHQEA